MWKKWTLSQFEIFDTLNILLKISFQVAKCLVTPDGSKSVTICQSNTLLVWDNNTGKSIGGRQQLEYPVNNNMRKTPDRKAIGRKLRDLLDFFDLTLYFIQVESSSITPDSTKLNIVSGDSLYVRDLRTDEIKTVKIVS